MLVWIHDLEKNPDRENEYAPGPPRTRAELEGLGISDATPTWSVHTLERYNAATDLAEAPIKVQIVSSADLASHPVGPFFSLYWYEHPHQSVETIQAENRQKLQVDWEQKVTLGEVREAFALRQQTRSVTLRRSACGVVRVHTRLV